MLRLSYLLAVLAVQMLLILSCSNNKSTNPNIFTPPTLGLQSLDNSKKIDLSKYANPSASSGDVYSDQMIVYQGKVYLLIQRYYLAPAFTLDSVGIVIQINPQNDSIEREMRLLTTNPGAIVGVNNCLLVTCSGNSIISGDGRIEKIDLSSGQSEVIFTESNFSAQCEGWYSLELKDDSIAYVSGSLGWGNAQVWKINFQTRTIIGKLSRIVNAFGGIAYSKTQDKLFVAEYDNVNVGVKVFSGLTDSMEAGAIPTQLPIQSMALYEKYGCSFLVLAETDGATGIIQTFDCTTNRIIGGSCVVYQDGVIRIVDGTPIVIERWSASNLVDIDFAGGVRAQLHLNDNTNPVDIDSVAPGKYYVSMNTANYLQILKR